MPGELFVHNAKDNIQGKKRISEANIQKTLAALQKLPTKSTGGLPLTISVKIGTKLMITRNIKTSEGLVNGASGILRHVTKKENSEEILIIWLEFESSNIGRSTRSEHLSYLKNNNLNMNLVPIYPVIISDIAIGTKLAARQQFPLILAEGMTVHKSQSQTFSSVCVHNSGMTRMMQYVAYSRVGHHGNLYIEGKFKPPAPLDNTSDLKVELDRLKIQKRLITFEQPSDDLEGIKIVFHNALSLHKYIGCVRFDIWFHGADIMIFAEARTVPADNIVIDGYEIIYRSDGNNINKKFLRGLIVYKKHYLDVTVVDNLTQNIQSNDNKKIEHLDLVSLVINDLLIIGGYASPDSFRK
ncbi:uncharacterized protein LOC130674818 [Microplitis mediator]|uniref:uncharacterized protein LOC130674818 n=1 Tax=Microplitis mediator TaxID=375433 RepID=UPI002556E506|nr:uncharacterized protein LOC130674818 [Microplitis mediator]